LSARIVFRKGCAHFCIQGRKKQADISINLYFCRAILG